MGVYQFFDFISMFVENKQEKMITAKIHHGHHGKIQSQGRL